ncbi:MAG: helix-turn-helix domain-containing protein [Streptosporangiaceae bacterium]
MGIDADTGGTDLGRRIKEQRDRAGLSRDQAAELAGMSPEYLAYLESSPMPNPTHASLTRLAGALKVDPATLSGAGMNLPPGQRGAAKNPVLENLTVEQCIAHVARGGIGRFLFDEPGRGPIAIPVNYKMDGDNVIFRTSGTSGFGAEMRVNAALGQQVSFDVDHLDDALGEGWSVLLSGAAHIITDPAELDRAKALGIEPWAGGDRDLYVRLTPAEITGRRIRVTG